MSLKTILFIILYASCCGGSLLAPIWGVLGYVVNYCVDPGNQWYGASIRHLGIRYSYVLALMIAFGMALNWRKLSFGKSILIKQEKLILLFLAVVLLSLVIGEKTVGRYTTVDHPSFKMVKVVIFLLMLTHVVTSFKDLNRLLWGMTIAALLLGLKAYDMPGGGRLESVGGPDFAESNFFAAFMATMLPIIAIQFMRSSWPGKVLCMFAGVFSLNAIVLTRSRGVLVGIAAGMGMAILYAPKKYRTVITIGLFAVLLVGYYLTDPQFRARAATITDSQGERDKSSQSRFDLSRAAVRIIADHPLGVGAGNFYQTIGKYDRRYAGKDVHNTYLRCGTELGLQGIAIFILIILNAFRLLRRVIQRAKKLPSNLHKDSMLISYALTISLITLLGCCITVSMLYVEFIWWLLILPVCLWRVLENIEAEQKLIKANTGKNTQGNTYKAAR